MKNKDNTIEEYPLVIGAFAYFINHPHEEVYLREFGRKQSISPNTAQRFLDFFVKEGLLIESRKGNLRYFRANTESVSYRQIKIAYNVVSIEKSGLIKEFRGRNFSHLVLFGSYGRGENDAGSDIDLVAIGPVKQVNLGAIEKKLGRPINAHFFSWGEWEKQSVKNKAFYEDVVHEGIVLIGGRPIV